MKEKPPWNLDHGSLIERIRTHANSKPKAVAFWFEESPTTFGELETLSNQVAFGLRSQKVNPEDRILLCLPNSAEFVISFIGILKAGCVAVPLFHQSGLERLKRIADICQSTIAILKDRPESEKLIPFRSLRFKDLLVAGFSQRTGKDWNQDFKSAAFLQFTSGSTSDPKGVILSHESLMINIYQMIESMEITERDRFVSWLPVHHDMGLILMVLVPLVMGQEFKLLPVGLTRIHAWLNTIQKWKATFTAAPDFAYRLCPRAVKDGQTYNLLSLRVALNASEPVRMETIKQFESHFRLKNVITPAYGLAEATVGLTCSTPGTAPKVDSFGRVGLGHPFRGIEIRIADPDNKPCEPETTGRIQFRSPAGCLGYWNNPEATSTLKTKDGFWNTGDLGYVTKEGSLFFVSREKNTIITAGRTVAPQEIEEIVDSFSWVRSSAAIGAEWNGEQLVVFAELKRISDKDLATCHREIIREIHEQMGFRPAHVFLLKPKSIPRTLNGKIQYPKLKDWFEKSEYTEFIQVVYPLPAFHSND